MSVAAIVAAAGSGVRLGAPRPKAVVTVGGRTLVEHAVATLRASGVDTVVVAAPAELMDDVATLVPDAIVVTGGPVRQASVRSALASLPPDADVVLVHDAARAFVPVDVVRRVVAAVRGGADVVVPVLPLTDTVKEVDANDVVLRTVDRSALRLVQTPQGFVRDVLERAHELDADVTDDASLAELLGASVHIVDGSPEAFKVTTPHDLLVAEALLAARAAHV